ncbi:MAG: hypothetical protein DHS20C05_02850 [Hyphococcus sp.]|nr:MAG: hypothetical protein DHS20C05_02850 [Marinicaulis sp.]
MRAFFETIGVFLLTMSLSAPAIAEGPEGFDAIYDEPTKVNLGGRPVIADIAYYVNKEAAEDGDLQLALVTDVTKFITETERDLKNWVATRQDRCGERWSAGDPVIAFPPGAIQFSLELNIELWNCGWNGRGEPSRLAREGGKVEVILQPYVKDGKLQAYLEEFSIDEQTGVSKYLPLEYVIRRVMTNELYKLNQNPKFYRAPTPLLEENFVYESIEAEETATGRVIITARYKAEGTTAALDRVVENTRDTGITQKPREKN